MRFTALKALTAALIAAPLATPAAIQLLQPSVAATSSGSAQTYASAQGASCPSSTNSPNSGESRWQGGSGNTTYDARGKTFNQNENNVYPIFLNGSGTCFVGGTVAGQISKSNKWWDLKKCCNGAGLVVNGPAKLLGVRTDNVSVDGIRINKRAATLVSDMHQTYTRDDCISNITHADLVIQDSLFDGCHTGISWRSQGKAKTRPFKLDISDSLFYVQPMPGNNQGSCNWGDGGNSNGPMWKMDKYRGPVHLKNVVIRQDLGNHECVDKWPTGTFDNVTFVWTSSRPYPAASEIPPGVKVTGDVSVWNNAKAAWLARHNGGGNDGGGSGNPTPKPSPTTEPTPKPSPTTDPTPGPTTPPPGGGSSPITKVMLVMEENHDVDQARAGMPFLMSQATQYGEARNYHALDDNSMPNYIALTAGSMFGITQNVEPADKPIKGDSLFSQLSKAGKTTKSYMESMPSNCDWSKVHDPYSNHHNPWIYYSDDQPNCKKYDVPLGTTSKGALLNDVNAGLPNFSLVVPDKNNDAHDGTLAKADTWLKNWLTVVKAGPDWKSGHLAIIVTFDEWADTSTTDQVINVVISPTTNKVVSNTSYDHYSLLRTLSEIFGVTPLRNAATAKSMRSEFHL